MLLAAGPDANLSAAWEIRAERAEVDWTRVHYLAVGDSNDPNGSTFSNERERRSGRETYADARLRFTADDARGGQLFRPSALHAVALEAQGIGALSAAASETWAVGSTSNTSTAADALTATMQIPTQFPVFRSRGLGGQLSGTLDVALWGGNLVVDAGADHATYRSGAWWENATLTAASPRGAARDQYGALLTLHLVNATVVLRQDSGIAQWTGPNVRLDVGGELILRQTVGLLQSSERFYSLENETVRLEGSVGATFGSAGDGSGRLSADLRAPEASLQRPPSGLLAASAGSAVAPWVGPAAWLVVGLVLVAVAAAALCVGYVRGRKDPQAAAEKALLERRSRRATFWARRVVRLDPQSVDGWFVLGASHLQRGDFSGTIKALKPAMESLKSGLPSLAYLVALAEVRRGRRSAASRWLATAVQDPAVASRVRQDEALGDLLGEAPTRRLLERFEAAAYA